MKKLKRIICIFAILFNATAFILSCSQNVNFDSNETYEQEQLEEKDKTYTKSIKISKYGRGCHSGGGRHPSNTVCQ